MLPVWRVIVSSLLLRFTPVYGASDINEVRKPSFDPVLQDCPLPCVDYTNIHSWIPYFSVSRLHRCREPLLLQFSVTEPLDDPKSNILIRACSLASGLSAQSTKDAGVENPKYASDLFQSSLSTAPACVSAGAISRDELQFATTNGNGNGNNDRSAKTIAVLDGMGSYFDAGGNCDENFLYAYNNGTVAGLYIGGGLGKSTVGAALKALSERQELEGLAGNRTIAQICGNGRSADHTFGVAIDTTGNLAAIQKATLRWSTGDCTTFPGVEPGPPLSNVVITEVTKSNISLIANGTTYNNLTSSGLTRFLDRRSLNSKRATCRYQEIVSGDTCATLVTKCAISVADFYKFNPKSDLCSTLAVGNFVCCSAGDPYTKPTPAKPTSNPDGTCATHLIANNDDCSKVATKYGITVAELEKWNKGKTWAWTECKNMLLGYNMCISDGKAPLPPPQAGTACGPLMPGTKPPANGQSLADLNPCPLNACCSNWGFCGVFPGHCEIHAPVGGGPGTKLEGFQNTCVSNCGNEIKKNSGPPSSYSRIGYYESYNFNRDCLWMNVSNSDTDGTYTHMHWGFADIDPKTFKPIITDPGNQWEAFKKLKLKRIISFGGWAYSTEAKTYNIIREAIITNRDLFALNLAQFVEDEGIDGVDIDWEYPGAPDITVDGKPIAKDTDGADYLAFLKQLKSFLGTSGSVSIAAPASFWYLKAFPIDKIAAEIDYIVYMTYDLHGQWDYGNPNSFDQCDSGKCIRSHINMTETMNALSMITKAGVPNNKVFVGEASYGRSFHMAKDGCWEPMCDFTGSRTLSEAKPGRCTNAGGYLAFAEIVEILRGGGVRTFTDTNSDSEIMLYKGDYVSYMTPEQKEKRREKWKDLSIDWAVDLQHFGDEDIETPVKLPNEGEKGCIAGQPLTLNSVGLCEFTCSFGYCPTSLCKCSVQGSVAKAPAPNNFEYRALSPLDLELNRMCNFACKRNYCPEDVCEMMPPEVEEEEEADPDEGMQDMWDYREQNEMRCYFWKDPAMDAFESEQCKRPCQKALDDAKAENRTTNYGCVGFWPGKTSIPWQKVPGFKHEMSVGRCSCDNWVLNEIADTVLEALPMIAQIGCYILMSSLKLVLDIGVEFFTGGTGRVLDAGLDMATTAAQMASYIYPEQEDPAGAFSWWLSPCGGTDLVPDDIKKVFNILNTVADGVSSFRPPKKIKKGSGKKGDEANPHDQSTPRTPIRNGKNNKQKKCNIRPSMRTRRIGRGLNTMRTLTCVTNAGTTKTQTNDDIVVSAVYAANAVATQINKACPAAASQACYHYSSANRVNTHWSTLTCPPEAASTAWRLDGVATDTWALQHAGKGWLGSPHLESVKAVKAYSVCQMDEWPPAYLLDAADPAMLLGGINTLGQAVRYLPGKQNGMGGQLWRGVCFEPVISELSDAEFKRRFSLDPIPSIVYNTNRKGDIITETHATVTVSKRPRFAITAWPTPPPAPPNHPGWSAGLAANPCWDNTQAARDPGFAVLTFDPFYNNNPPVYNYAAAYVKGKNGD